MSKPQVSPREPNPPLRYLGLFLVAGLSCGLQLALCRFFTGGQEVPISIDINPSNLFRFAYSFPPLGFYSVNNWLGQAFLPLPLNPFSLAANLPSWLFFTAYVPILALGALLAMVAFLRELGLGRLASLFGGVVFAWQGDFLSFIYPGHFAYLTTWPLFALGAWAALRAGRRRNWAYPLLGGLCCGVMVQMQPDRAGMASLLIAALFLLPMLLRRASWRHTLPRLGLCVGAAVVVALASLLALNQTYIQGIKLGGNADREQTYSFTTQYSLSPEETFTYLAPGFFGWHVNDSSTPYWGRIGRPLGWPKQGDRNSNLAISTVGTVPTVLALLGGLLLLVPAGRAGNSGPATRAYLRFLLGIALGALVLAWGYHTPLYRPLLDLPLMDKWRNPLKWLELVNFVLPALGAYGLERLLNSSQPSAEANSLHSKWPRRLFLALASFLACGLVGLFVGLVAFPGTLSAYLKTLKYSELEQVNATQTAQFALVLALAELGLLVASLSLVANPDRARKLTWENPLLERGWRWAVQPHVFPCLGLGACLCLTIAQMAWVDTHFIQPISLAGMTGETALTQRLKAEGNRVRVSADAHDLVLNALMQNQFIADDISCLEISAASRVPDDLQDFFRALYPYRPRLWSLTGVKNVVLAQEDVDDLKKVPGVEAQIDHVEGFTIVPEQRADLPSHALIVLRDHLEKVTFVPAAEVITDKAKLLQRLVDPAWDPRSSVLLSESPPLRGASPPVATGASGLARIDLLDYSPNRIAIGVEAIQPGYLLVNDRYDPDWRTEIDGTPAPLARADFLLRAIAIPAGTSRVTLHYEARYQIGPWRVPAAPINLFSDGCLLAGLAGVAYLLRMRRGQLREALI